MHCIFTRQTHDIAPYPWLHRITDKQDSIWHRRKRILQKIDKNFRHNKTVLHDVIAFKMPTIRKKRLFVKTLKKTPHIPPLSVKRSNDPHVSQFQDRYGIKWIQIAKREENCLWGLRHRFFSRRWKGLNKNRPWRRGVQLKIYRIPLNVFYPSHLMGWVK